MRFLSCDLELASFETESADARFPVRMRRHIALHLFPLLFSNRAYALKPVQPFLRIPECRETLI